MKIARFTSVVEAAGRPDVHILLTRPKDDKVLQTAIGRHRVMTVHQDRVRGRADHGTVGFDPGPSRQYLIFPRSIAQFAGRVIVAIKYELLAEAEPAARSSGSQKVGRPNNPRSKAGHARPSPTKIVPFAEPEISRGKRKGKPSSSERSLSKSSRRGSGTRR